MSKERVIATLSLLDPPRKRGRKRSSRGEGLDQRFYAVAVVMIIAGIVLHLPLLLVGGVVLLVLLATTDIWARYCLRDVTYQRHLSGQRVLFGEKIVLAVSIENAKLLPLPWLEVEDEFARALVVAGLPKRTRLRTTNRSSLECLFSLRWYERVTRRYTIQCTSRGVYAIGPATICSGDVFGFLKREMEVADRQYVLVYPLIVPLSSFHLPSRHPFGDHRASRRLFEDPTRIIGVRDYVYGDSLKRVDWKATARVMQLQSRIYEPTTIYTLTLFLNVATQLDTHYSMHPGLRELSICVAASVADWAIDQGYAVGLYANTFMYMPEEESELDSKQEHNLDAVLADQLRRRRIRLPAASNEEQRKRIMEALARVQSYFRTSLEELLLAERAHLPAGSTVVVITSSLSESLVEILVRFQRSGHIVTILFVGDNPPPLKVAGIIVHHLGGDEVWERLRTAAIDPAHDKTRVMAAEFHV